MNTSPKYKALLRSTFNAIIGSGLSPRDLKSLAEELRRGRLTDELAFLIDQVNRHFFSEFDERDEHSIVASAEILVKERKVSRSELASILLSLGAPKPASNASIRKMLIDFSRAVPSSMMKKLIEVLESSGEGDAFLAGISSTRK